MASLAPTITLPRDLRKAAATLGRNEARYLVDTYYSLQDFRIESTNQVAAIKRGELEEPHETLLFFGEQFRILEDSIKGALDVYSAADTLGAWCREHVGIGPVIAAGLISNIDLDKAPNPSSIWRFAGLAPGQRLKKGEKRDWNARLKVLCWKMGDSFVKQSGHEKCYYGHLYRAQKEKYVERDLAGAHAETARKTLEERNVTDKATRERYEAGRLPDGRLDLMARRYAVKRFLLNYWQAAWLLKHGIEAPKSYVHEQLGHQHVEPSPVPFPQP